MAHRMHIPKAPEGTEPDVFEEMIRRIVREEIRAHRLLATCYSSWQESGDILEMVAAETVACVDVRCPLCRDAQPLELPITAGNTPPVYFIQSEYNLWVKIGYGEPEKRISHMRSGSPVALRLVASTHAGGEALEKALHYRFKDSRKHGEWFELTRPLLHAIHQVRRQWAFLNFHRDPVLVPAEWLSE